jgi:hypothetical protein
MSPKKSAPGAAVGRKRAVSLPTPRAKKEVELPKSKVELLDAQREAASSSSAPDKKRGRTEDSSIQKSLHDNFPGFSEEAMYINQVGGRTLEQTIREDRQRPKSDKFPMGKLYYETLRTQFQAPNSVWTKLTVLDVDQPEDPQFVAAADAFHATKKSYEELIVWCETVSAINQMIFVGLLRMLLKAPPSKSMQNCSITIAAMNMIKRLDLQTRFTDEVSAMKSHFDACCCKSLASFKSQQMTGAKWWQTNKSWATLVLPEQETDRAFSEEVSLATVAGSIHAVVASSEVGFRLLGRAERQLRFEELTVEIQDQVRTFEGVADITTKLIEDKKNEWLVKMKVGGHDPLARIVPKEMPFKYRGQEIKVTVTSPLDQYQIAVESYIRGLAVDAKLLPPLWSEDELVPKRPKVDISIDNAALRGSLCSRHALAEHLEDDVATNENIQEILRRKASFLVSTDRFWRIEHAFWSSFTGEAAQEKIHALILDCFPKPGDQKTLEEVQNAFAVAESSKVLAFAGSGMQIVFRTCKGYITTMLLGKSPSLDRFSDTSFYTRLQAALGRLCWFAESAGSAARKVIFGTEAAKAKLAAALANDPLKYEHLVPSLTFVFLLDVVDQQKLQKAKSDVMAKANMKGGSEHHEAKHEKPKKTAVDTRAMVKALFAK